MSLDRQFREYSKQERYRSVYKQGVADKSLCRAGHIIKFKILPAFNPEDPNPETSFLPSIMPNGEVSDIGAFVLMSQFLGHGKSKSSIVSPKTLHPDAPCPLTDLGKAINSDEAAWGYLINGDEEAKRQRVFSFPTRRLMLNIISMDDPTLGVMVGSLNKSAFTSLMHLMLARNNNPQALEMAKTSGDYLIGYANGDITHPTAGLVLACQQADKEKGSFSSYTVTVYYERDMQTKREAPKTFPIGGDWLSLRHDIANPESYLNIDSYEGIVGQLKELYNMRSPDGYHEWELLNMAFPEYGIVPPARIQRSVAQAPAAQPVVAPTPPPSTVTPTYPSTAAPTYQTMAAPSTAARHTMPSPQVAPDVQQEPSAEITALKGAMATNPAPKGSAGKSSNSDILSQLKSGTIK